MRYLITGGAGFIGSHLTDALAAKSHNVTVLDDLSTGAERNLIAAPPDRVTLVRGSVLDPLLVDELVSGADVVIHLAAAVGVQLVMRSPLRSFVTNIRGTENVLEAAHRYRRKLLLASTSEIYGKSEDAPFREDGERLLGSPQVLRWAYSTAKAADEILAFEYHRERGLPTVIVRLFNTVGPRQTGAYGMVLPRLVGQALAGEPLTVFGDGRQSRCFCHVGDVVDSLIALLDEPAAEGDVFNVGSTEEITIFDLAQRIIQATGSSSEVQFVSYEEAYEPGFEDMRRRVPDITKIGNLIGWKPTRTLDQIIAEIVAEVADSTPEARNRPLAENQSVRLP